jgi:hypothetical protein
MLSGHWRSIAIDILQSPPDAAACPNTKKTRGNEVKKTYRVRAAAVATVSALAFVGASTSTQVLFTPAAAESTKADPSPPTGAEMMAMSKDQATREIAAQVGVSVDRMSELMAAQESLKKLDHSADPGFVELMPEYTPAGLMVKYLSTSSSDAGIAMRQLRSTADIKPEFITVPFGVDELLAAGERARTVLALPADSTIAIEDGAVVFITEEPADPEHKKLVEAAAAPVGVIWRVEKLSTPTVGGGGAMSTCTGGFTVRVVGGSNQGISTAGHCGDSQTYSGNTVTTVAGGEAYSGNADVQFMRNASMTWNPSVYLGSSPNWPVEHRKNWDNAGINDSVCRYGKNTGGCGILLDKWYQPSYVPSGSMSFGLMSGTTSIGGDSGGPVYYGNTAWGIHSGFTSTGRNIFTPHDRLSSRLGVQVMIQ